MRHLAIFFMTVLIVIILMFSIQLGDVKDAAGYPIKKSTPTPFRFVPMDGYPVNTPTVTLPVSTIDPGAPRTVYFVQLDPYARQGEGFRFPQWVEWCWNITCYDYSTRFRLWTRPPSIPIADCPIEWGVDVREPWETSWSPYYDSGICVNETKEENDYRPRLTAWSNLTVAVWFNVVSVEHAKYPLPYQIFEIIVTGS